ncbi:hypothetical protein GCM10023321_49900 [Pseudonocardia eucalypti]|uniref:Mce/MlaD domain-containing protein n=1 Tax=Pseudonocardia eucalypti TaxID=648755 RepID=A0ABP9QK22_9PSEU|nr:phospholipid/cholesterol/gamma-HCH transport system substrate-binding protein [Pseudonocardia eucalypti]
MARNPNSKTGTYVIGVIGILVVVGIGLLAATAHKGLPFVPRTEVRAAFTNVDSLKPGDEVREFSSRIGQVEKIDYVDGKAVVTMALDGDREAYADASAQVWDFSALAQKFVELNLGTPTAGPLGDRVIASERNTDSDSINELLNVFDPKTRAATSTFLADFGGGMTGHGQGFQGLVHNSPALVKDIGSVSSALADPDAELPETLRSIDRLAGRFADRRGDIEATVRDFGTTMEAISVDDAKPLSASLQKLPSTLDTAKTALDALNTPLSDTASAFETGRPGFKGLGDATPDTRAFLRDSRTPLDKVPDVSDDAKPAVRELSDTFADVSPLAPKVRTTFENAAEPLDVLKGYARETGWWAVRLHSFVSESVAPGIHYANANANVGAATVTGSVIRDRFTVPRNPYPKPGAASFDRAGAPGGK